MPATVNSVREVPVSRGLVALVDASDYPLVCGLSWNPLKSTRRNAVYARTKIKGRTVLMHRLLMGEPEGFEVDHEDGNGLNNCRSNLRACSKSQNQSNRAKPRAGRSQFKGVAPSGSKWIAHVVHERRKRHLGTYSTELEAALAYNAAAIELHGEFAHLNEVGQHQETRGEDAARKDSRRNAARKARTHTR